MCVCGTMIAYRTYNFVLDILKESRELPVLSEWE